LIKETKIYILLCTFLFLLLCMFRFILIVMYVPVYSYCYVCSVYSYCYVCSGLLLLCMFRLFLLLCMFRFILIVMYVPILIFMYVPILIVMYVTFYSYCYVCSGLFLLLCMFCFILIVMYVPFSVFCVLFVCKCVLYCCHRVLTKCVLYCCHRVSTQLQLTINNNKTVFAKIKNLTFYNYVIFNIFCMLLLPNAFCQSMQHAHKSSSMSEVRSDYSQHPNFIRSSFSYSKYKAIFSNYILDFPISPPSTYPRYELCCLNISIVFSSQCHHMSLMDFVVSPPGCGRSVTDF
jgi:hypothetical protein